MDVSLCPVAQYLSCDTIWLISGSDDLLGREEEDSPCYSLRR